MRGHRRNWPATMSPAELGALLEPGDYAGPWRGWLWLFCSPHGELGSVDARAGTHVIEEHEDDTVSLQPSLHYGMTRGALPSASPGDFEHSGAFDLAYFGLGYHGWLKRGEWTESA